MHINILNENECAIITDLINTSDKIIVCCHVNPDGDAIGSTLAWTEYLRTLGKHPMLVVPDQFPDFLHWLGWKYQADRCAQVQYRRSPS